MRSSSIVTLDAIDRKKKKGIFGRLLVTRWSGGQKVHKTEPFGHYMFCGPQRSGKTSSCLWYAEQLLKRYRKRHIKTFDDRTMKFIRFDVPPKIKLWSNFGVGRPITRATMFDLIDRFDPYANEIRIILIDEIHTYFPRDGIIGKDEKLVVSKLNAVFSQLAKRNVFLLSTAQVYGRLEKSMREQCLYMVDCRVNMHHRLVNDFILEKSIIADDLGRWSGDPKFIRVHGLSKMEYDTKRLIRE